MSKAKVIVKVGDDFFTIAQNVWKMFKGSKDVVRSSATVAKREGRTIKNASQGTIKNKAQTNKLRRAHEANVARGGLKRAGERTKNIDLKSRYLKNGKPKPKTKTTNGTKTNGTTSSTTKKSPWSTTKSKPTSSTQAQKLRDADVARGPKITSTNAKSGNIVTRGGKRAGVIVTKGGKKFIQTKTGKLIAIGAAGAGGYYLGKAIDKSIAGTNGAATTSSGAATTTKPKPPKPSATLMSGRPEDRKSRDIAADMRHFAISKGGTQDDPNRGFRRRLFGKNVSESKAKKDMEAAYKREQDDRYETPNKLVEKDKYKYGTGRRSQLKGKQGKKKGGSVIKRNKGGPVRGVGKALRGYGNNSTYSNKMY